MSFSDRPFDSAFGSDSRERSFDSGSAQQMGFNRFDRHNGLLHMSQRQHSQQQQQQQQQHMSPSRQMASSRHGGSPLLSRAADAMHHVFDEESHGKHGLLQTHGVRRDIIIALGLALFAIILSALYHWWKQYNSRPRWMGDYDVHGQSCVCRACIPRAMGMQQVMNNGGMTKSCLPAGAIANPFAPTVASSPAAMAAMAPMQTPGRPPVQPPAAAQRYHH